MNSTVSTGYAADRSIDARSIVTLIIFFGANALVIFPLRIPLPPLIGDWYQSSRRYLLGNNAAPEESPEGRQMHVESHVQTAPPRPPSPTSTEHLHHSHQSTHFTLGLSTAPIMSVLLLLASTCITGSVVRTGIVGSQGVRPYDIMTLFLSFAYISLSLDCTGLLRYLAFNVASRAASRGGRFLFAALYVLFVVLALVVGNDPIVLSGTPFVAYFTSHARIRPPTGFVFAQFQAANLASALLVSSNPTNLVLTSSFGLSFLSFSAWTSLPTIAAALALYPTLAFLFSSTLPRSLSPPAVDPRAALTDASGAAFGATVFIVAIGSLVGLSAAGLLEGVEGVWTVTAPAALLVLMRDCGHDVISRRGREREREAKNRAISVNVAIEMVDIGPGVACQPDDERGHEQESCEEGHNGDAKDEQGQAGQKTITGAESTPDIPQSQTKPLPSMPRRRTNSKLPTSQASPGVSTPEAESVSIPNQRHSKHPVAWCRLTFPTTSLVISRLPLNLVPFAFAMFILVESLEFTGWVRVFANWWDAWARASGAAGCIWLMAVLSVLGCNVFGTNIGATVLLSRVLQQWRAISGPSDRALYGSVLALAVGSNFGAYSFVFSASLAGLLWRDILSQKALSVSQREFIRWNALPLAITMIVGCLVVGAEVCVMFP